MRAHAITTTTLALLLSLLALGALGLVACGGDDDEATADTSAATLSPKQEAEQHPGGGRAAAAGHAHRTPTELGQTTAPSEPNGSASTLTSKQETKQRIERAKQRIERIGDKWAPLFAAGKPACGGHVLAEACSRIECEHVYDGRPIKNCSPLSPGLRKSFADATVQDIALRRFTSGAIGYKAGAKFSNGETVLFHLDGPGWSIVKVGGNPGRGWRWLEDRL